MHKMEKLHGGESQGVKQNVVNGPNVSQCAQGVNAGPQIAQAVLRGLSEVGRAALGYVRRGLLVFPCREVTTFGPDLDRAGQAKDHYKWHFGAERCQKMSLCIQIAEANIVLNAIRIY